MIKEKLLKIRDEIDELIKNDIEGNLIKNDELIHIATLEDEIGKYELWSFPENTENVLNWWDAIKYCNELGGNLPSIKELDCLYNHNAILKRKYNINTFKHIRYWSSTEISDTDSICKYFPNGTCYTPDKTYINGVRAIKRIRV